MPTYGPEFEGKTATDKNGNRIKIVNGEPVPIGRGVVRAKPSATDHKILREASDKAQVERDALRTYAEAEAAIDRMGTGPTKAAWMDAITFEKDGGLLDTVGGIIGAPFRRLHGEDAWNARDHLKTVEANATLAAGQVAKGSASDRDMIVFRLTGVTPEKSATENKRIIRDASKQAGLEQVRARLKAFWIGKFGSLTQPAPNGRTFEQTLLEGERRFTQRMAARERGKPIPRKLTGRKPPKAPPRRTVTIDINGNPL